MKHRDLNHRDESFLVTGGAGFIGTNLVLALLRGAQRVTVLDNFLTGKRENIQIIKDVMKAEGIASDRLRFIEGDIRDKDACMEATSGVDYVLHNAALGSVPRSIKDPQTSAEINVGGMLQMLKAASDNKVRRFVYASSSSVYGDSAKLPKREGEEGSPLSPYAVTKCTNELYGEVFRRSYGLSTVGLRYFNVFGPLQDAHSTYAAVIPIFVKNILSGEASTINGDGETSRDFTYIDNVVHANIRAALAELSDNDGQNVFNIACGGRYTLNELYADIAELLGCEDLKPIYGPERAGDVRHSFADIERARAVLGYAPEVDMKEGLRLSIDWYKKNL